MTSCLTCMRSEVQVLYRPPLFPRHCPPKPKISGKIPVLYSFLANYSTNPVQILGHQLLNRQIAGLGFTYANILGVDVITILGEGGEKTKKRGPKCKWERQLEQAKQLPPSEQKFVSKFLEQVLSKSPK